MLAEGTAADFGAAKRKAAAKLGVREASQHPDNLELQRALIDYLNVFDAAGHADRMRHLREQALVAMQFFQELAPRLVGPVLYGSACAHTPVTLHVFHDEPEAVARRLIDGGFEYQTGQQELRFAAGDLRVMPMFRLFVEGTEFELIIFPTNHKSSAPMSPLDGRPMQRAGINKVRDLLAAGP